ncbi:MAG: DUF1566 domain-containing protein [Niabella sp.]|nr:MAG: DUF1566 domain-containing protein [Niabella sp.]
MTKYSILGLLLILWMPTVFAAKLYQPCRIGLITETTPTSQFKDNTDGTVTDLKTKLIWKKCIEGMTWQATTNSCIDNTSLEDMMTWQEALAKASDLNASGGFAGAVNWRLPNIKELSSVIENACYGPSINLNVFPSSPSGIFWSSTPYIGAPDYAWSVRFNYGQNSMNFKYDYYFARLVRDPLQQ